MKSEGGSMTEMSVRRAVRRPSFRFVPEKAAAFEEARRRLFGVSSF